jgi:hypothetical protein
MEAGTNAGGEGHPPVLVSSLPEIRDLVLVAGFLVPRIDTEG